MKPRTGEFGDTEWAIMKICFEREMVTVKDVMKILNEEKYHSYMTVKTIIDRLADKKILHRDKIGPVYVYKPLKQSKTIINKAIDEFLDLVLDNSVEPLFAHIVKHHDKYKIDSTELKKIADSIDEE